MISETQYTTYGKNHKGTTSTTTTLTSLNLRTARQHLSLLAFYPNTWPPFLSIQSHVLGDMKQRQVLSNHLFLILLWIPVPLRIPPTTSLSHLLTGASVHLLCTCPNIGSFYWVKKKIDERNRCWSFSIVLRLNTSGAIRKCSSKNQWLWYLLRFRGWWEWENTERKFGEKGCKKKELVDPNGTEEKGVARGRKMEENENNFL